MSETLDTIVKATKEKLDKQIHLLKTIEGCLNELKEVCPELEFEITFKDNKGLGKIPTNIGVEKRLTVNM